MKTEVKKTPVNTRVRMPRMMIGLAVRPEEEKVLRERAAAEGLPICTWLRRAARRDLKRKPTPME
jgi:hypothetical protein